MRIALAQINPTVGDVAANTDKHLEAIERARAEKADLVVFPEMSVLGYPPKDLLLKPAVLEACERAVQRIAEACTDITAVAGYPEPNPGKKGRDLFNAAAVCSAGRVVHRRHKALLPTYDVFDELRYFEPGAKTDLTEIAGRKVGISICEDLWNQQDVVSRQLYHDNPIDQLAAGGVELFINCSASPFAVRKNEFRRRLIQHAAKKHRLPVVFVNQVGGNDELIFDGNSCVVDSNGEMVAQAKDFEEDLVFVDFDTNSKLEARNSKQHTPRDGLASVYAALVLGLRDYCRKCGFKKLVLGLSGGIDSAVTAAIAAAAVGGENVTGIAMPSRYSSEHSKSDAEVLADKLGMRYMTVPIDPAHVAMETMLTDAFDAELGDITAQNIQARLRGIILMGYSNQHGSMLVTTGNKSEIAVGYCTLYGDMAGGLAIISDVPKTMVYDLARHINARELPGAIPESTITKPPSAELRPDQKDEDTLPGYDILDPIVERYIERHDSASKIITETGYDAALVRKVVRMIDRNEYKRKQMPPGLKITSRAFGSGRRMPIAQHWRESD